MSNANQKWAVESREIFLALIDAGFDKDQAIRLLAAAVVARGR